MRILALETSCDETAAAVVEKTQSHKPTVLSSVIASSSNLHAVSGGIIPEKAAREQLHYILPIIGQSLFESQNKLYTKDTSFAEINTILAKSIDAIAVTQGPGLIGSLLIGVETAKTLSYATNIPLIPVNHLLAHLYANFLTHDFATTPFPFIGLIVSGGHTDLLLFKDHGIFDWLGGTRDDAAGEALDKIGRILNLPYPGGPEIEREAMKSSNKIVFSRALIHSDDFDFSFSGLKTEVARFVQKQSTLHTQLRADICKAVQTSITSTLVTKTLKAAQTYNCKTIFLGGGVSANQALRDEFAEAITREGANTSIFFPDRTYTTDNAAMIGAYAVYNSETTPWQHVHANPSLYLTS